MTLVVTTAWWAPVPAETANRFTDANPLERNVYIALQALALIVLCQRRQRVVALLRSNGALVAFFSYCAVSLLWSDYPDIAVKRLIKALGDVLVVMIVLTEDNRLLAIKRFLTRPCFFLIPLSVLLIKYYPQWGQRYNVSDAVSEYTGITESKNMLGMICLVFGIGAEWTLIRMLKEGRRGWPAIRQATVLFMTMWLFWKCNSVTSMSCFIMATTLMVWTTVPSLTAKRTLMNSVIATFLILAFVTLFLDLGAIILKSMGRNPTLTGRTELWENLRGMNPNPLLGAGFESFWIGPRLAHLWSIMAWRPNEAHNGYIEMYLNLGYAGLALLGVVVATAYRRALALLRVNPPECGLMLAYIVISLAYSFTEAGFRMMSPMWIILLLAMIAVSQAPALQESEVRVDPKPAQPHRFVVTKPRFAPGLQAG